MTYTYYYYEYSYVLVHMKPHKRKISEYENSLYFYYFLNPLEITEN